MEITGPKPQYRFLYAVPPEALSKIAYIFDYRHLDGRDPADYSDKLGDAVQRWRERSPSDARSLFYRCGPGFIVGYDRRPGFESADYRFEGVTAKIYLGCDSGATPNALHAALVAEGYDTFSIEELEEYLNGLVDSRLMYREGNQFLSLAVAWPGAQNEPRMQSDASMHHKLLRSEA